jgi:LDH2 family malate/lactate/ureidoglycolate dehydrogenase
MCSKMRAVPPAAGFDKVLVPGDRSAQTVRERRGAGIPVAEATWQAVVKTAAELGVTV